MVSTALTTGRCGDGTRAACRIAGDDRRGHSQDPVCMAAENKKQVDYCRVRHANQINKTASGLCRRIVGQIRGTG